MSYIIQRFQIDVGADINDVGEPFEESLQLLESTGDIKVIGYTNPAIVYPPEQQSPAHGSQPELKTILPAVIEVFKDLENVIDREPDIEEIRKALGYLEFIDESRKKLKEHIQTEIHERLVESDHKFYIHNEDGNA